MIHIVREYPAGIRMECARAVEAEDMERAIIKALETTCIGYSAEGLRKCSEDDERYFTADGSRTIHAEEVAVTEWHPVIREVRHHLGRGEVIIDDAEGVCPALMGYIEYHGDGGIETGLDYDGCYKLAIDMHLDRAEDIVLRGVLGCQCIWDAVDELTAEAAANDPYIDSTGREYTINGSILRCSALWDRIRGAVENAAPGLGPDRYDEVTRICVDEIMGHLDDVEITTDMIRSALGLRYDDVIGRIEIRAAFPESY